MSTNDATRSRDGDPLTARAEVVALLHRLAVAADAANDSELDTRYRPCFTHDALWEMRTGSGIDRRLGIEQIMAGVAERRRAGRNGPGTGVRHHVTSVVVEPTAAETWTATSYYLVTGATGTVRSSGWYSDQVVRVDGLCRISHRVVHMATASSASPPEREDDPPVGA